MDQLIFFRKAGAKERDVVFHIPFLVLFYLLFSASA